jgi:serine/threonine-protein kinase
MLDALHHAHEVRDPTGAPAELVHRDVSMRNVMVTYGGEVKVIDFGMVKASFGEFRTATGTVLGTPRTMSPEQAMGEPVDRRSDVYSASVVLFELSTGRPLVQSSGGVVEILREVLLAPSPPPSSIVPDLPRAFDAVIARGLAKDARDRWPSAAAMQAALAAAVPVHDGARQELAELVGRLFPDRSILALATSVDCETPDLPITRVEVPRPASLAPLPAPCRRVWRAAPVLAIVALTLAVTTAVSRREAPQPEAIPQPPVVSDPPVAPPISVVPSSRPTIDPVEPPPSRATPVRGPPRRLEPIAPPADPPAQPRDSPVETLRRLVRRGR